MTQDEKQLLLKDLCARLPYGVNVEIKGRYDDGERYIRISELDYTMLGYMYDDESSIIPYLRPMSSMTEEEKEKLQLLHDIICDENYEDGYSPAAWDAIVEWEDYCNSNHLDYRGLIPMGLALEAPDDMYK